MSTAGYSYGGYDGAYQHPDATAELSGPGSTAHAGGPYAYSYAAENGQGAIYTQNVSYYGTNLTVTTSYGYDGAGYSFSAHDTYIDYGVQTPGSPLGDGTRYGGYLPAGYGSLDSVDLYGTAVTASSGAGSSSASENVTTERFSSGYAISYYSHATSESYGGQPVPGAQDVTSYATLTDPSGYMSTFYR